MSRFEVIFARLLQRNRLDQKVITSVSIIDPDPRANHQLIFKEIKNYTERQYVQMDSLDAKGGLIAATSTALTAGFVALLNGVPNEASNTTGRASRIPIVDRHIGDQDLLYILLAVAFITFIIVLFGLMLAVRTRRWEIVPNPSVLIDEYWEKTANETLADLCATMAKTASDNQRMLDDKMKWIGRSFVLLGMDVLFLFLSILVGVSAGLL